MYNLKFNPKPSTIMHIDMNSCFATVEQQANPHLRGKPVAVAAYTTPSGCIIAPSVEAKKLGIKVGMRVRDGKLICPNLIVLEPDPWKYRAAHLALRKIISDYTNEFFPKSIDEFVLDLEGYPCLVASSMQQVAREIKRRIRKKVGEAIVVSIGIAPNRFLAKVAAGLNKPDGLDEINKDNFLNLYSNLKLTDLCGIKVKNTIRLNSVGIYTVLDFYNAEVWHLRAAFQSILGYYWFVRLHGWEIDDVEFGRRSYGNSYALPASPYGSQGRPKPFVTPEELSPILSKLVTKMGARLRRAGYKARGVHLSILFRDWSHWHKAKSFSRALFDSRDIYKVAFRILLMSSHKKPVRELAVSVFGLLRSDFTQFELFEDINKKEKLVEAIDKVNERWGDFVVTPARMISATDAVPDRIAYGGIKELEEFTILR
jgi:DNA polymerase-4